MAPNIFSRMAPSATNSRSFYDNLPGLNDGGDLEAQGGGNIDQQNLLENFQEYDLEHACDLITDSRISAGSTSNANGRGSSNTRLVLDHHGQDWLPNDDDADNDVPASLLVEPREYVDNTQPMIAPVETRRRSEFGQSSPNRAIPGSFASRLQFPEGGHPPVLGKSASMLGIASNAPKEKAMWRWVNVSNLDIFIQDIYNYFEGSGLWCILTDRALHLIETTFVGAFLTFLTQCVDYSKIPKSSSLQEILVPQCTKNMSALWTIGLWFYAFYFILKCFQLAVEIPRLSHVRDFYIHLLDIPDQDIQTVSWQDVVARLMALRDANPKTAANIPSRLRKWIGNQSKERLDAHDIANRLMRKDNYLIAMFNKDILDLSLPLPFVGDRPFLSRTLEWYINFSIVDFVFDHRGQLNQEFLRADSRAFLSRKLRQRFLFAGILNLMLAPFVLAYVLIVYFFTYFIEYKQDATKIGAGRYTPFAEWKFREFNELPHLFYERLNMSYPFATRYMDQFPKRITERIARSIAFISGALAGVLAVASILDPQLFLGFEITHDKTALFYGAILGGIWATARGRLSEDTLVFDPEYAMRDVIQYTHYMPAVWKDRLHSFDVKQEFSELYKLKVVIFLEELLGIITTPIILLMSLPKCSDQIIDFFREFTIHVDGLGYVCSFAVFDFKKGVEQPTASNDVRDDYYSTKHGKMAASYYGFLDNYVINPKTGIPGHVPHTHRVQFHPPPPFPGLNSPTLAAEVRGSRKDRGDGERSRARGAASHTSQQPRFGSSVPQPSPMASILLDPHHQPTTVTLGSRSVHRPRQSRGVFVGDVGIMEESAEGGMLRTRGRVGDSDGDADDLGESQWETSPAKLLSRENSAMRQQEPEPGVLGLIYQFQQAHRHSKPGVF